MSLLNALGDNADQRHQIKLLESLLNKWLVEREVSGRNESIFCITLLSQYDMVSHNLLTIIPHSYVSCAATIATVCQPKHAKR